MEKLKIDPEFRDKIPAMTDEQFNGLREDILRDGYVRDPLVVWKEENTLLDGHHRWRIICENWETLKEKFSIVYKNFDNRWAALEWICRNQLNKHNLNDEQITYITGEMYKARKKSHGGTGANQYNRSQIDQNDPSAKRSNPKSTAEALARELGVAEATVKRSEKFHDGIDAIREVSKEAADKVMAGGSGATKQEVKSFPTMAPEEKSKFVDDIVSGAIKTNRSQSKSKEEREPRTLTESIAADMYDPNSVPEFTIDMLIGSIKANSRNFTETLSIILKERKSLITDKTRDRVEETIDKYVIEETVKIIKELVNK